MTDQIIVWAMTGLLVTCLVCAVVLLIREIWCQR